MFTTSELTDQIDDALAKAQAEIESALKNKVNPHFKSRYADLTAHFEACRESLAKHSISLTQWPIHSEDGRLHLLTRLAHKGQWLKAEMSLPLSKQDPQGMGSSITYARRFALAAALGISTDDDDGNAASGPAKITEAQVARIFGVAKEKAWGRSQILELAKIGGVTRLEDMPQDRYENFCHVIQTKTPEEVLKGKA